MDPGWTELVGRDEDITDSAEGRRLMESRLAERGVSLGDLDLSTDIEIRLWNVRGPSGESRPCVYSYLVRDEAMRR